MRTKKTRLWKSNVGEPERSNILMRRHHNLMAEMPMTRMPMVTRILIILVYLLGQAACRPILVIPTLWMPVLTQTRVMPVHLWAKAACWPLLVVLLKSRSVGASHCH
jgi:hypothetical protein